MVPSSTALVTAASVSVSIYCVRRLLSHASAFLDSGNHAALCGDSEWAWSLQSDCFREGFLWPALLLLGSGLASLAITLCLVLPPKPLSGFASDGSAPLARLAVGARRTSVRRPPGSAILIDTRLRVGSHVLMVLAIQTVLYAVWWYNTSATNTNNNNNNNNNNNTTTKDSLYLTALIESTLMVLFASIAFLVALWRSDRMVYAGLFPWILPALVGIQFVSGVVEIYASFFTDKNLSVPVVGSRASLRSNLLVSTSAVSVVIIILYSRVQKRPIFVRAMDGLDGISSAHSLGDDSDYNDATPLARPNEHKTNDLVDTPEFRSSWFDCLSFSWANDILRKGSQRQLQYSDLYKLGQLDMPVHSWRRYLRHRKPGRSLFAAMAITLAPEFISQAVLSIIRCVLEFGGPFFLQRIIRAIELSSNESSSSNTNFRKAYLDAFGLLLSILVGTVFGNQTLWIGRHVGVRIKGLLVAELSSKTLRRRGKGSWDEEKDTAAEEDPEDDDDSGLSTAAADGKIMNLLTADFQRVIEVSAYLDQIYAMPLSLLIGIWYMYQMLGSAALVGLSFAAIYAPLTKIMFARLTVIEEKLNAISDKRVSMITELLQGIKAVKLFGWESRFLQNVDKQRENQLSYLWKVFTWWLRIGVVSSLGPMLILIIIFTTYVAVLGHTLTAEIAFTSISVFQLVRIVFEHMPGYLSWSINAYVSLGRIESYLGQPQVQELEKRVAEGPVNTLGFESADLEWESTEGSKDAPKADAANSPTATAANYSEATTSVGTPVVERTEINKQPSENTPLLTESSARGHVALCPSSSTTSLGHENDMVSFSLKNIDVQFPIGGLSLVSGPTGSGKSSLLSAMIGEMTLTRGRILLPTIHSSEIAASDSKYEDVIELSGEGLAIHDISYVAQEAWLRNATIRENVLFGEAYNKERYEEVLRVCALKPDLRILSAGDMTEIGERGVTLSGGQKQRVALARAVYSSRRIMLIDDCLSAVDSHTAKHILLECLVGKTKLMEGRTRVLVTHHVAMCLPHTQYMVMMHEGQIMLKGVPSELQSQGSLSSVLEDLESSEPDTAVQNNEDDAKKLAAKDPKGKSIEGILDDKNGADQADGAEEKNNLSKSVNDTKPEDEYNIERLKKIAEQKGLDPDSDISALQGTLVEEEEREEGYVKFEVWKTYLLACGTKMFWITALLMMVLWQLVEILQDYWIRIWVTSTSNNSAGIGMASTRASLSTVASIMPFYSSGFVHSTAAYLTGPAADMHVNSTIGNGTTSAAGVDAQYAKHHSTAYWLGIYVLIGFVNVAWRTIQSFIVYYGSIKASRTIHARLIQTIVRATPRFFDSTPLGRIINRFSRDMQTIDEETLETVIWWFADIIAVLGVFTIITAVTPAFIVVAVTVSLVYASIAYYYLNTSRELKRLESNSMSPLLSLFGELILGVSTIRAFGVKQFYIKEAINRIGTHNRPYYMVWSANRWLSFRIDFAGAMVSFSCALFIITSLDWMDAGLAGFVLSYALTFSERMLWVIRNYSSNELNMNAVERVTQYLKVEQEAPLKSEPQNKPPAAWPRKGDVQIENLVIEYIPGVPVLHDISLSTTHGEKVGVVGRTGAGKSTMSLALLRFIEASKGRVVLDGVDISKIGLEDLRRNVTIIPQDPVLFNGTIRFNLDPFNEYPDELVWDALRRTHLVRERGSQTASTAASVAEGANDEAPMLERMAGIFKSLDAEIKENGQNLSLGQRQLVALARALVRRSRLIIMDEATASVDFDTDNRIQRTIRGPEFANSTLFCIAHRLRTVIDYDRVLVLDKGKVAEFDTPYNLLQNENGIFRSMCEQSGEYEHLTAAATANHKNDDDSGEADAH
ncbi:hypothetical protein EV179_003268 [Coemansia sp. RSA 487]|nr:hypothetical protein EV179_003268 [Coemansia sp. RSA 487]